MIDRDGIREEGEALFDDLLNGKLNLALRKNYVRKDVAY